MPWPAGAAASILALTRTRETEDKGSILKKNLQNNVHSIVNELVSASFDLYIANIRAEEKRKMKRVSKEKTAFFNV